MKILALSRDTPQADWKGREELLRAEAAKVWTLQMSGVLREIHFTVPGRDAVLLLECSSVEDAQSALGELPLVKAGLIEFQCIQLTAYDGFERLFR